MNYYVPDNRPSRVAGWLATAGYIIILLLLLWLVQGTTRKSDSGERSRGEIVMMIDFTEGGAVAMGEEGAPSSVTADQSAPDTHSEPLLTQSTRPEPAIPTAGNSQTAAATSTQSASNPAASTPTTATTFTPVSGAGTLSTSTGAGSGSGTDGAGYSDHTLDLKGRSPVAGLVEPKYDVQKRGEIVVEITVNEAGNVVYANILGNNMSSAQLGRAAIEAAYATRFSPSDIKLQTGTITYIFRPK